MSYYTDKCSWVSRTRSPSTGSFTDADPVELDCYWETLSKVKQGKDGTPITLKARVQFGDNIPIKEDDVIRLTMKGNLVINTTQDYKVTSSNQQSIHADDSVKTTEVELV